MHKRAPHVEQAQLREVHSPPLHLLQTHGPCLHIPRYCLRQVSGPSHYSLQQATGGPYTINLLETLKSSDLNIHIQDPQSGLVTLQQILHRVRAHGRKRCVNLPLDSPAGDKCMDSSRLMACGGPQVVQKLCNIV